MRALVPGKGSVADTTTDSSGRFALDTKGSAAWVRFRAEEYHARTVAVGADADPIVELTPRNGTVSLSFCGDVMFGRRFYGRTDEPGPRVRISPSTRLADHRAILGGVAPLLHSADITSVNLETPLTTTEWRHPEKVFTFVSHPVAARALADAGVEYCALGNNHSFDALEPGLTDTRAALDSAGIAYSGAGRSSETAWRPALVERRDVTVGFLSCTTIVEPQYDIDLSADRGQYRTHTVTRETDDGRTSITFPGDVGAAEPTEPRLSSRVADTADRADVTVVQIHGGYDYRPRPIAKIRGLADAAIRAGADLVACHQSHVTGGLEIRNGALVAWSLGNFVFDQTRWATFPSYVLTAHVGPAGVQRAYIEPVLLVGYAPTGVVAEPRTDQLWRTAGLSSGEFALDHPTLQYVRGRTAAGQTAATRTAATRTAASPTPATRTAGTRTTGIRTTGIRTAGTRTTGIRTAIRSFEGTGLYARQVGWPRSVVEGGGALQFGRDQLPTGRFDDPTVDGPAGDDRANGEPLWHVETASSGSSDPGEYPANGTVRLVRDADAAEPVVLGPVSRIPVSGPATVAGRYRSGASSGMDVRVTWYEVVGASPLDAGRFPIAGPTDGWELVRWDLVPPGGAEYVDVAVRLTPPASGQRVVAIDDLRMIEWTPNATGGREFDHLRMEGSATVEFAAGAGSMADSGESGEIRWSELTR